MKIDKTLLGMVLIISIFTVSLSIFLYNFIVKNDDDQESYFINSDSLNPSNIDNIKIYDFRLKEKGYTIDNLHDITETIHALNHATQSTFSYKKGSLDYNRIFLIHITNKGHYANPPLAIYENGVIYNLDGGKVLYANQEEFNTLISTIDQIITK